MGGGGIDAFPPSTQYLTQLRRPSFDIYDIYVNCGFAVVTRLRDWHHIYWTCLDGREFVERETPKTFSSVCLVDHYATIVCNSFCIAATERSADEYDEPIFDTYVYRLDLNHHNETPFWQCVGRLQVDIASLDCDFVSTNNIVCRCNDGADPEEEGLVLARVARPANVDSDDIIEILISDHFKVQVVKLFPTNARYACAIATMQDEFIGAIVDLQSECTVWVTNIFKSRLDMWMRNLRVTDTTALLSVVDVGDTASKEEFIVPFVDSLLSGPPIPFKCAETQKPGDEGPGNVDNKAPSKEDTGNEASTKKGDRDEPLSHEKRYGEPPAMKPRAKAQTEEKNPEDTSKMKVYDGAKGKLLGGAKSKKKPSEALWKRKHQKTPSDDTPQSPTSSSDIPFLYGLSGKETFYILPKLDTCKLSLREFDSDGSNSCVAAYAAASCEKRADMDVTVYAVDGTHWTTKEYNSTIIESDGKMQFDNLTAHGNTHLYLTKRLNGIKKLYELDTSIRNKPYGRDFFYGVREGTRLIVDIFGPDGKGYCRINDRTIPKGVEVVVFPAGRSLFARIAREGSPKNLLLNGFVRGTFFSMEEDEDDKADPTDPKSYWRGIEYENTPHLRQCDDLVKWYRDFA